MSDLNPRKSLSPSPPPVAPLATTSLPSHRFLTLRKVYTEAIRATLRTNTYENFSSCFPTPATYCPRALEGVWKQLNMRLEDECLRDFEKICTERDIEERLAAWERLIENAKTRRMETQGQRNEVGKPDETPLHMLDAQELYSAHMAPALLNAENDLKNKLSTMQQMNKETAGNIKIQRSEIQKLIDQIEGLVDDVEGAARAIETDEMRKDLNTGVAYVDQDVKMKG